MWDTYGTNYRGTVNVTQGGKTCQNWSSQTPHKHNYSWVGEFNFCRNPNSVSYKPWCFTEDPNVVWDNCDIPLCGK